MFYIFLTDETSKVDEKYRSGFNSCFNEVLSYISSNDSCKPEVRARVLSHLADKFTSSNYSKYTPLKSPVCAEAQFRNTIIPSTDCVSGLDHSRLRKRETTNPTYDQNNNLQFIPHPETENSSRRQSPVISSPVIHSTNVVAEPANATQLKQGAVQLPNSINVNGPVTLLVPTNVIGAGNSCMIPIAVPSLTSNASTILVACENSGPNSPSLHDTSSGTFPCYKDEGKENSTIGNSKVGHCEEQFVQNTDNFNKNQSLISSYKTNTGSNNLTNSTECSSINGYEHAQRCTVYPSFYKHSDEIFSGHQHISESNQFPPRQSVSDPSCTTYPHHNALKHNPAKVWRPWNV